MPNNVEIKAKIDCLETLKKTAALLSGTDGEVIQQEDTFFNSPNGRLKLRQLQDAPAQLIYYARPDQSGPKLSSYHITTTTDPENLKQTLALSMGVVGNVKKERMLYMVGQTRVHCDRVETLGDFMELEVVMGEGQPAEEGEKIAEDLMLKLGVKKENLLTCAYMDMILANQKNTVSGSTNGTH